MAEVHPEDYLPFAEELATRAGEVVRRYFRRPFTVHEKGDLSPVTIADREVETTLRAAIRNAYPDHGVIGEEFSPTQSDAEWVWVIDPIDGTKSFLIGRPIFGTLIALLHRGQPVMGIIDQPIIGERWLGMSGIPTSFNFSPVHTRLCPDLKLATLCTTSPNLFSGKDTEAFERLRKSVKYTVYGGDCYSYGLLASGHVDIVLESDLKAHDFCALAPIVMGAGGLITDWRGNPLTLESAGHVLACGDRRTHAAALELLNR
ncbi:MAG: histidinol-phosphatase [Hyphomicrobiales bacterium]|nr:histidinol-phosphatase [Rickettsiales bacterium]MCP5361279.1 histidinol-phosphatase [Hyphomicrobiales bacterium]